MIACSSLVIYAFDGNKLLRETPNKTSGTAFWNPFSLTLASCICRFLPYTHILKSGDE